MEESYRNENLKSQDPCWSAAAEVQFKDLLLELETNKLATADGIKKMVKLASQIESAAIDAGKVVAGERIVDRSAFLRNIVFTIYLLCKEE